MGCRAVVESYDAWVRDSDALWNHPELQSDTETTVLYDTVAVLCAACPDSDWIDWKTLRLTVSDYGETTKCKKPEGSATKTALGWRNLDAFLDWVAHRLAPCEKTRCVNNAK